MQRAFSVWKKLYSNNMLDISEATKARDLKLLSLSFETWKSLTDNSRVLFLKSLIIVNHK